MRKCAYILALLIVSSTILSGCQSKSCWRYKAGDYVKHKLDGRIGIVISNDYGDQAHPQYMVRFPAQQSKTETHLLSADGAVKESTYADVSCNEFELDPAEQPKPK